MGTSDVYKIIGGNRLYGSVTAQTSKNSVLPILAACTLTEKTVVINNFPNLSDTDNMLSAITALGGTAEKKSSRAIIDGANISAYVCNKALCSPIRSSVLLLGALLGRFNRAVISKPGGCNLGSRPIDLHIEAFKRLGVEFEYDDELIYARAHKYQPNIVDLPFPSVGATENIMLYAVKNEGTTLIRNAAREPEIVDLADFLISLGGKIRGAGSNIIRIDGVKKLGGCEFTPITDRIEAGTFLIAAASCGGEIEVVGCPYEKIRSLTDKLSESTCKVSCINDKIYINSSSIRNALGTVEAMPYNGFPTDLQAQLAAYACILRGETRIIDRVFSSRFSYAEELKKMGADITVTEGGLIVRGVDEIKGAKLKCYDLRGGAATVIAALTATGLSEICGVNHIDRGYENFEGKLCALGADIYRAKGQSSE